MPIAINEYLDAAIDAARKAGAVIMEVYSSDFAIEQKNDSSPLTIADKRAHEVITEHLKTISGERIPLLSEEGKDIPYCERRTWNRFWLVDPLDGTKEFIKRNGEFTVNIALIEGQRPVLGVIYVPESKLLYYGAAGIGAFKIQGTLKTMLPCKVRRNCYTIIGSRSHATPQQETFVERIKEEHGDVELISAGSALKFCLVAEGKADVYPRLGPTMEWDTAAGQALVECAGGTVLCLDSTSPLSYNKRELVNPFFVAKGVEN